MLRKIGACSLGLMCLVAISSLAFSADESAEEAPTIGELEAFAGPVEVPPPDVGAEAEEPEPMEAPSMMAEEPEVEEPAEPMERADAILEAAVTKKVVEQQAREAQAANLVSQAHHLLYVENKPAEAYELAAKAVDLDPENREAQDLKTNAGLTLNKKEEVIKFQVEKEAEGPRVRVEASRQALKNTLVEAAQLYAEGEFEEAIELLRQGQFHVSYLAVYTDVTAEARQLENLLDRAEEAYAEQQKALATLEKRESAIAARERVEEITRQKKRERIKRAEAVLDLIEAREFEEARFAIENMRVEDPSDEIPDMLLDKAVREHDTFETKRLNAEREYGKLRLSRVEERREVLPERLFNYPDKKLWQEVIAERAPYAYKPSDKIEKERSDEDQAIYDHLEDPVTLSFEQTPLTQVVEFLQQVTEANYSLRYQDLPVDEAPVSLTIETSLENALDQITELTGMAWKVDGGLVKIGLPESLREYDLRVYPVGDLLLSTEDRFGGEDVSLGGGSGDAGGGSLGSDSRDGGGFGRFSATGLNAQFGTGGGGQDGGDEEDELTDLNVRAQNLILLMKNVCGRGTWEDEGQTGLIDVEDEDGQGGTAIGGGGGFGGGATAPTGFGAQPTGFGGPGGGGFGAPGGGVGAGVGPQIQAPQGRAFVTANDPLNIMIVQTEEVHECIENLLTEMRDAMRIQIQVDVRFISVETEFVREVGFSWPHFNLNPDDYDEAGNIDGFNLASGSYGSFSPWVQPLIEIIFDDEGNPVANPIGLPFGFGHPFGTPEITDNGDGTFTFEKTPLQGTPLINTGIPFFGGTQAGLSFGFGYAGDSLDIAGFFRMAHQRDEATTVSCPSITLSNGQLGFISIVTEEAYIAEYDVSESTLLPVVDSVADGVSLQVRPIASADLKYVFLELAPTIQVTDITFREPYTTFVGQPGGGDGSAAGEAVTNFVTLPEITQQTLETTVGVPDRGVLVVGGLTRGLREHREGGVPIFDKIPLLKRLFSAEGRQIDRNTLFVLARPQIILLPEEEKRMR